MPTRIDEQPDSTVLGRIRRISIAAYFAFAIWTVFANGFRAFVGLTCSAAVAMISFLWLEVVIGSLLQPAPHLHARRLTLRAVARFALLAAATAVMVLVARFNGLSVLLGFSIVVVGIIGEALYATYRSLTGTQSN